MKDKLYILPIIISIVLLEASLINKGIERTGSFAGEGLVIPLALLIWTSLKMMRSDAKKIKERIDGADDE